MGRDNSKNAQVISKLMFIDSHAHLTFPEYDNDRKEAIARAREMGVTEIINIGSGMGIEGNSASLKLARANQGIYSTIGFHPHDAAKILEKGDEPFESVRKLADDKKVVAVGEIGLDYHYVGKDGRPAQIECFKRLLTMAKNLKLPVIIHDREAHEDTLFTLCSLRATDWGGVMHCFSGDVKFASQVLDLGFYISITGAVTFKKKAEGLQDVVKYVPIERLLIETDCPFIAPEPYRGKRNEPAYVIEVAKKVAELKNLSLEDVGRITSLNARRLFHLEGELPEAKIAYAIRNSLYLNITNHCNLKCVFCPKQSGSFEVKGYNLRLSREPDVEDVFSAIGDASGFKEVVFCGFGEPLTRLELVKTIAKRLKENGVYIRIDTDGLANLAHGRNVLPELKGAVDAVSVSINAPDITAYNKLCPSKYGDKAFAAACDFIREAKKYIPSVTATVVSCPGVNISAAEKFVTRELGVAFRVRQYQEVG